MTIPVAECGGPSTGGVVAGALILLAFVVAYGAVGRAMWRSATRAAVVSAFLLAVLVGGASLLVNSDDLDYRAGLRIAIALGAAAAIGLVASRVWRARLAPTLGAAVAGAGFAPLGFVALLTFAVLATSLCLD